MSSKGERREVNRQGGGVTAALKASLRRIDAIAAVFALAWLLASCAVGLWLSNQSLTDRLDKASVVAHADTKATAGLVDRLFHELTAIPEVLSASQDLRAI